MLNIIFRTDSSDIIGSGHVYRCLNLASIIENSNIEFICKNFNNNCISIIEKKYKVNILERNKNFIIDRDESTWLGDTVFEDTKKTIEILKNKEIDWLIIDHYSIERKWEEIVKPYVKNVLVIEDYTNREHLCDVLLNQNLQPLDKNLYKNLTPNGCKLLLGKEYLLFNTKFIEASKSKKLISKLQRINVFMGGGDSSNETEKIIEIGNNINIKLNYPFIFDVVVGSSNKNKNEIEKICKKYKNFNFYWNVDNMEELYSKADLAIGAIGFSSYERCIMKLPTLSIVTAKNQEIVLPLFLKNNIIEYLGDLKEDYSSKLNRLILKFYKEKDELIEMSNNCQDFINYNLCQDFSKTINNILKKNGVSN
jgi:UDP-2,4-diacetamido-2,4,6-trideoxy-beta-L-altropyranose hydrolase